MRYSLPLHDPATSTEELVPEALAEGMRAVDDYTKAFDAAGELVVQDSLFADGAWTGTTSPDEVRSAQRRRCGSLVHES